MKRLILSFSFLLASVFVYSQITFERQYSYTSRETAYSVLQTSDGGYIAAGEDGNAAGTALIIRTNEYGDTLWTKVYGGNLSQRFIKIILTSDNNYILCGDTWGLVPYSVNGLLRKINLDGDTLWQRAYGGNSDDGFNNVIQTNEGGYAMTGYTMSFGQSLFAGYFVKTNSIGDTLWTRIYEKANSNHLDDLLQLADSGYLIAGGTAAINVDDIYLIRTNKIGDTLWTKTIGGVGQENAKIVQQTSDGGFLLCGGTTSYGAGGSDVYIVKVSSSGQVLWTKTIGGTNDDTNYGGGIPTSDGGYAILGSTKSFGSGGYDFYLIKLNSNCDTLWTRTFGSNWEDIGCSIKETFDGGFILAGWSNDWDLGGSTEKAYLIKTNANGHVVGIDDYSSSMNNGITVYPNPFSTSTQISFDKTYQTLDLSLIDLQGKIIQQKSYHDCNKINLDRAGIATGFYFLRISLDGKFVETKKIVVTD